MIINVTKLTYPILIKTNMITQIVRGGCKETCCLCHFNDIVKNVIYVNALHVLIVRCYRLHNGSILIYMIGGKIFRHERWKCPPREGIIWMVIHK